MKCGQILKTMTSKKGNTVIFRPPKKEDFDAVWGFACDLSAEDTFVELSGQPAPTREYEEKYFSQLLIDCDKGTKIYIAVEVNDVFAGSGEVRIGSYRRAHAGNIGLALAPKFREEGIGTVLLKILIEESRKKGLLVLTLHCFENNHVALAIYRKLGFIVSGIVPEAIKFGDSLIGEITLYLPLS